MTPLQGVSPPKDYFPKGHASATISTNAALNIFGSAKGTGVNSKNIKSTLQKKRKFTGGAETGKKSLEDVLNHENKEFESESYHSTKRREEIAQSSEWKAPGHRIVPSLYDGKDFVDDDDDLSIAPLTASNCGTPVPKKTKVIDLKLVSMPVGKKRYGGEVTFIITGCTLLWY